MAPRKRKSGAKPKKETSTDPVKPSEVLKMIPAGALDTILKLDKRTKNSQSELAGELGSAIAKACERYGTNRKALGIVRMLNRMEIEKVADFLDHLDYLLDVSGIEERASKVQKLPLEPKNEDDGEGDAPPADGKVSRPQFGARQTQAAE